jgi:hypothetical protein
MNRFVEVASQVRERTVTYKLSERSILLKKNGWFREVRRLCDKGHQTSIITTRQDLSMEESPGESFCAGTRKTISNTCGNNMVLIILYPGVLNRQIRKTGSESAEKNVEKRTGEKTQTVQNQKRALCNQNSG